MADYGSFMKVYNAGNVEKDSAKTLALAKDYLSKYPDGKYTDKAKFAIQWAEGDLFSQAFVGGDYGRDFVIGKEILEAEPNNLLVHYQLVFVGDVLFNSGKWDNVNEVMTHCDKVEAVNQQRRKTNHI